VYAADIEVQKKSRKNKLDHSKKRKMKNTTLEQFQHYRKKRKKKKNHQN
jgi:hypothetical protein